MIAVRELTRTFGRTLVLKGISLDIGRGEFLALMGESGSGKSTLLNLISGIDAPDSGTIEINGTPLVGLDEDALTRFRRRHIGFVFQFFNLLEHLSVRGNVEVPLLLEGGISMAEVRRRAMEMLELVGMEGLADRGMDELSGGERQRVAIARAMVHRPDILIADEPTGSLDSRNSEHVLSLIRDLASTGGITVVMATHSAHVSAAADRVAHISDGRITGD